jgi:O-antigen/teichoic acid export membrane protein
MSSKVKTLFKGSVLRVTEFFAGAVVGLLLMPFIIHSLGDKMYGLWIFVGSFLGYYSLMDFGLNSAVQRFISRAIGSKDYTEINKIVNTSLVIFAIVGAIALVVSFFSAFVLPLLIKNIAEVALFRKVILILGLNFAIGFPLRVFSGILAANLRFDIKTKTELIKLGVRTILIIIFLKNGYGIVALALITLVADISGYAAYYFVVRHLYKFIVISNKLFDKSKVRHLFGYSFYTFVSQISNQLIYNIDNLVIVTFLGLVPVTMYSIGSRLIKYFMDFIGSAVGITMPVFSQYEGAGDYHSIREKYLLLTKISSYLSILVGGTLIIFGRALIIRWVGVRFEQSYIILLILLFPCIFNVMQSSCAELLYGISKHKYLAIANIIEGLANLTLSVILVKRYGIFGVALGTAIPMLVMKTVVQPIYVCKVIGISFKEYYFGLMAPIIAISAGILVGFWLIVRAGIVPNYLNIISLIILEIIVFAAIVYLVGFDKEEKRYFEGLAL